MPGSEKPQCRYSPTKHQQDYKVIISRQVSRSKEKPIKNEIPGLSAHSFAVLTIDSPETVYRFFFYNSADCVDVNIYTHQFFFRRKVVLLIFILILISE